jgi:hypothetical protein
MYPRSSQWQTLYLPDGPTYVPIRILRLWNATNGLYMAPGLPLYVEPKRVKFTDVETPGETHEAIAA